jgi:hypothetical protein
MMLRVGLSRNPYSVSVDVVGSKRSIDKYRFGIDGEFRFKNM